MKLIIKALTLFAAFAAFPMTARADGWFECQPTEVMEYSDRVHIRCSNTISLSGDTVRYLAISKSDDEKTARFISVGTAALLSGKKVRAYVYTSAASNTNNCLDSDCRTPSAWGVKN